MTRPRVRRWAVVVLCALVAIGCAQPAPQATGGVGSAAPAPGASPAGFDAATRDDAAFNAVFRHEFADVDGVRMHYLRGGPASTETPPLVLLHGWPQSWFEWRGIMPALAADRVVVAVDLPGLGDSTGSPPNYEKATLARYVHGLLADRLGYSSVDIAAHDLGAGVAFQYAVQFPQSVRRLAHMDYPLPGPGLPNAG